MVAPSLDGVGEKRSVLLLFGERESVQASPEEHFLRFDLSVGFGSVETEDDRTCRCELTILVGVCVVDVIADDGAGER